MVFSSNGTVRATDGLFVMHKPTAAATGGPRHDHSKYYRVGRAISVTETVASHAALLRGPLGFERSVAIHRLHHHLSADTAFLRPFVARLAALSAIPRPPVLLAAEDLGWWRGRLFIVTPPIQGPSLAVLFGRARQRGQLLSVRACCYVALEVAEGFHRLEQAGISPLGPVEETGIRVDRVGRVRWVDRSLRARRAAPLERARAYGLLGLLGRWLAPHHAGPHPASSGDAALISALRPLLARGSFRPAPDDPSTTGAFVRSLLALAPSVRELGRADWVRWFELLGDSVSLGHAESVPEARTVEARAAVSRRGAAQPDRSGGPPRRAGAAPCAAAGSHDGRPPGPGLRVPSGGVLPLARPASRWVVGRARGADLVLDDPDMSRSHFEVLRDSGDRLWIHDLRSKNGLRVNGVPTTRHQLSEGDEILAGGTVLRFEGSLAGC